jgi:hypothetical protein
VKCIINHVYTLHGIDKFVCVGVMYSDEYDVCGVTLSVHSGQICLTKVRIEPATFGTWNVELTVTSLIVAVDRSGK